MLIILLKTICCSGVLYAYYRIALYNRHHHQWNRVYLLSAVVLSILIPFIQINIPAGIFQNDTGAVQLLNVVAAGGELFNDESATPSKPSTFYPLFFPIYIAIAGLLLLSLVIKLFRLRNLYKTHHVQKRGSVNLILTQEKTAPFSFFNNIFWNTQIDIESAEGKNILQHELTHVRERHSADRLFMNVAVAVYWCNPFIWLIKKEICEVHEFLADQKSVTKLNLDSFSRMIIRTSYPNYNLDSISHFFTSPIKRRFLMLTKQQHPTSNLLSRWLALPVMLILFAGFTLKKDASRLRLTKPITVVIDAGHGGESAGAVAADGTREKDINLSIAKKIQVMNRNSNVKIILTREADVNLPLKELVANVVKQQPDAFISIHVNTGHQNDPGFEFYVSARNENYSKQSQLLGSLVSEKISNIYKVAPALKIGNNDRGIWVLDAPERNYPALLVECGNMANEEDLSFVKNTSNQDKIATQILKAIEEFGATTQ